MAVVPHPDWASFAPADKQMGEVLVEAYGADEAAAICQAFAETLESQFVFTAAYRADLSYLPGD